MALPVTITGISVAVAPVGPFKSSGGNYYFFGRDGTTATTLQAYKAPDPGSDAADTVYTIATDLALSVAFGSTATNPRRSQSFTTKADTSSIASISVGLLKLGTPTDNVTVELYLATGAGLPTGSSLGIATVAGATITTTATRYIFTFASPIAVAANTKYAAVVGRSGAVETANRYGMVRDSVTINVDANQASGVFDGSTWASSTTDYDLSVTGTAGGWSSIATRTGFTTAILNLAAYQVGNVIHMLVQDGTLSTSVAVKYVSFDMSTDTFLATTETVLAAGILTGQAASGWGISLVVRTVGAAAGHVVCFYNCVQTLTTTQRARVAYRIRTGVNTYGTETRVDSNTAIDNTSPIAVLGASDRVHLLWFNGTNTMQRHLTSANVLGTAASTGTTTATQDVDTRDDAGTIRFVGFTAANAFRWASADNPTVTNTTMATGTPVRTVDSGTIVYALYQNSADGDLYVKTSSDSGATFGSGTNTFTGTVAAAATAVSKNQHAYSRGSAVVFPYVVNDNGTLKYNEHTISAGVTHYTLPAATGTFILAGVTTGTKISRRQRADVYALALTGIAATLTKSTAVTHRTLTADAGAFAFAGQTVTLRHGHATIAATGTFAFSGQAVSLGYGHKLATATGTFAFSGQTITLRYGHALPAATGAFAFTGHAVTLAYASAKVITAAPGAFAFSGQPVNLAYSRVLPAGTGTFSFTGNNAALRYGHRLQAGTGTFAFAGIDAGLVQEGDTVLVPEPGSFAFTGHDVSLRIAHSPVVITGGGGHWEQPRPYPVEGTGFGILPRIEGHATGYVGAAGKSRGARIAIKAAAIGQRGHAGLAEATIDGIVAMGSGCTVTGGKGFGMMKFEGAAVGRHDDDEAAAVLFMLAA